MWAVVAAVLILGLRSSGLGRTIYAVGDNPIACRLAGVRIWQVLLAVYVIAGLFAAVGGLLFSGTTGSVGLDQTNSYLLPSVAATVIGGTSILGGMGGYAGTILGAIVLTAAQPAAPAPRHQRGVQADAVRRHRACCWRGCTSGSAGRRRARRDRASPMRASERRRERPATACVAGARRERMKAAIVGTGWMAAVHTEALRRIGVEVVGMVGSCPSARAAKANPLLPPASTRSTSCSPCPV